MSQAHAHTTGEQSRRSQLLTEAYRQYLIGAALVFAVAVHVGDVVTTAVGLSGGLVEAHPLTAYLIERVGFALWTTISITIMLAWAPISREIARRLWPGVVDHAMIVVLVSFGYYKMLVVGWNVGALWGAGVL